jgi:CTP:phosphocholine cytidylyltransferase-like protein
MNAIIMAAGTGSRLMPFTADRPKALVEIEGVSIIERQIRFFRERGVAGITIVTGHRPDSFAGLVARHPDISLVHNDKYDVWNNMYTVYLVRDRLEDSYVSESDVCMHANYIPSARPERSLVFGGFRSGFAKEWIIRTDASRRITRIDVEGGEGIIQCGLTYWTAADAPAVRARIEEMIGAGDFAARYWDDVFMSLFGELDIRLNEIDPAAWTEIDSPTDLEEARRKERRKWKGSSGSCAGNGNVVPL